MTNIPNEIDQSSRPDVSVVIPCYNYGRFLEETVQSVLEQTCTNFEIIIVDDDSTDPETIALLQRFEAPRTSIIHRQHQGPAATRNAGIEQANAEYIIALDADDRLAPTYIEKALARMRADQSLGIVYGLAEFFGNLSGLWRVAPYSFPDILFDNVIGVTAMFRKADWKRVGGYESTLFADGAEDYDFWLSLIELGVGVARIEEVTWYYRIHGPPRWMTTQEKRVQVMLSLFQRHRAMYLNHMDAFLLRYDTASLEAINGRATIDELRRECGRLASELDAMRGQCEQQARELAELKPRTNAG